MANSSCLGNPQEFGDISVLVLTRRDCVEAIRLLSDQYKSRERYVAEYLYGNEFLSFTGQA